MDLHFNIGAGLKALRAAVPVAASAAGSVNGPIIDRDGFESAVLQLSVGVATGGPTTATVAIKLQHGDLANGADMADFVPHVGAADIAAKAANTESHVDVNLLGAKQYVRAVPTVALAGGATPTLPYSATLVLGGARSKPVASY